MPAPSSTAKRRHPVLQVTLAVLAVQAMVQGLVAHSVVTRGWWDTEWVRLQLRLANPAAANAHSVPWPGWQGWVPSAVTALGSTLALVLLALLVARVGRGWWLLAVAALPLVPFELAPGSWAPPLTNQVAYALVWRAGATEPNTAWAWVSASITALLVALPAATLAAQRSRRPWVSPGQVLGRLVPVGLVFVLWLGWQESAGATPDTYITAWRGLLVVVGAMATTGIVRKWQVLVVLAVLPAFAAGAVRWTTGVDGVPVVVTDPSTLWMSVAAVAGGVFAAIAQPALVAGRRRGWAYWQAMLAADVERRNRARAARAVGVRGAHAAQDEHVQHDEHDDAEDPFDSDLVPDDLSELDVTYVLKIDENGRGELTAAAPPESASVSRRPGRAASARAGGRHRA